ncbi:uncharacterized protein TrAtP1_003811 [Trichoderma atroviride]|uniref:uncharacterized protein n=1 Tax=Hypocrea atroviridis TaxID=63577 RepID=UPI003326354F|nr:hypothetical protein TrAtP1_003811 [Trichoderma atroviride]
MSRNHLPSHHQLYTALIPSSPPSDDSNWRQQLLTLHVVFPSLLLPALDLLDRGLVSRLIVANPAQAAASHPSHVPQDSETEPVQGQLTDRDLVGQEATSFSKDQICMYSVQSAASATSRGRRRHIPQASKSYAVHIDAWSCNCGSFALDAYSNYDVTSITEQLQESGISSGGFGSLGMDAWLGLQEDFPCCKHLLACLLAEKWRGAPRGHVEDRYITKEELAAIIGGL